jgi:hypothetical protein
MNPSEKPPDSMTPAEIDALYGLEPALDDAPSTDSSPTAEFVTVDCPYCGEAFDTRADASAGSCTYVEDCQVCCQPIEMELHVDEDGKLRELLARRGDS